VIGRESSVRSVHTSKSDGTELISSSVILPHFICAIPKEVLLHALDSVCNLAKTNCSFRIMLISFVSKLIKGNYNPKYSASPKFKYEQGDFVRLILTHDAIKSKPKKKPGGHLKTITYEHGDSNFDVVESDGFNLPTLFGEYEDFTNVGYDSNDFKYSDLFDENDEVYVDTLWSSTDPRDFLVRDEHGCLMSVFDVYTVTVVTSPFGPLTEMSAHPNHPRGVRPKTTVATPKVRYACVACEFEDFKTAHSLRRHLIQIPNISCDTLVQGRPFPHVGYVMRKPNEREKHKF